MCPNDMSRMAHGIMHASGHDLMSEILALAWKSCIPGYHVVSVVDAQKDGVPGAAGPDYTERPDRNRPVSYCESKSSCTRTECRRDRFSYRWDG